MSFCNSVYSSVSNHTTTENGALTNISTTDAIVDFFFHGAALRNEPNEERIINLFEKAFNQDPTKALRILFYIRDIRGGQGERRVFRIILTSLAQNEEEWVIKYLDSIPTYGRWDDIIYLLSEDIPSTVKNKIVTIIKAQLKADLDQASKNRAITLLAKWMPSENASSIKTKDLANYLISALNVTKKVYRKTLSTLRKHTNIVENNLRTKEYSTINYSTLPTKASMKYTKAFYRNDKSNFSKFIESIKEGKTKINAKVVYPYEIVQMLQKGNYDLAEAMWKNLPDYLGDVQGLVVADTSGSMRGTPMNVSISLALYVAERNKNKAFKDYFISFSETPKFHRIKGNTFIEKCNSIKLGDIASTNIQAVFDLILDRAEAMNIPKSDMPKMLFIVSDMEFNQATRNNTMTNFEVIRNKYAESEYEMPTLVFWNVNSRRNQTPVTINDRGVILISGCSPVIFKYALSTCNGIMGIINNVTESDRYNIISY